MARIYHTLVCIPNDHVHSHWSNIQPFFHSVLCILLLRWGTLTRCLGLKASQGRSSFMGVQDEQFYGRYKKKSPKTITNEAPALFHKKYFPGVQSKLSIEDLASETMGGQWSPSASRKWCASILVELNDFIPVNCFRGACNCRNSPGRYPWFGDVWRIHICLWVKTHPEEHQSSW